MGNSNTPRFYMGPPAKEQPKQVAKVEATKPNTHPLGPSGPVGMPFVGLKGSRSPQGPHGPVGLPKPQVSAGGSGGLTGFLGGLAHEVGYGLGQAGHGINVGYQAVNNAGNTTENFLNNATDKAGHDVAAFPMGLLRAVNQAVNPHHSGVDFLHGVVDALGAPFAHPLDPNAGMQRLDHWATAGWSGKEGAGAQWSAALSHPDRYYQDTLKGKYGQSAGADAGLIKGTADTYKNALEHPGKDPFMTALTVLPLASAASKLGVAAKAGYAGEEGALGNLSTRFINVPKVLKTKVTHEPVQLTAFGNAFPRLLQAGHDKLIEGSLNRRAQAVAAGTAGEKVSPLLKYAQNRVGGTIRETTRRAEQTSSTLPSELDRVSRTATGLFNVLGKRGVGNKGFGNGLTKREGNLALILRSSNLLPHEIRDFWNKSVLDAKHPHLVQHWADLAHSLHEKGVLSIKRGKVVINPAFTKLREIDSTVQKGQTYRETAIRKTGRFTNETLQNRLDLVSKKVLEGTGTSRKGQGFFSLKTINKDLPKQPQPANSSGIMGFLKPFGGSKAHFAKGSGIKEGLLPANMIHSIAHTTREAVQYTNKLRYRQMVARYGSKLKTGKNDELVLDHNAKAWATKLTPEQRIAAGTHKDATVDPLDQASINAAYEQHLNDLFPLRNPDHPLSGYKGSHIGDEAPKGYTWVPKRYLGDVAKPTTSKSGIAKSFDNVNQAVTAATVYFKISHIPQRATTDSSTSLVSGALYSRKTWKFAAHLRQELGQDGFNKATASTGVHGYASLPRGEGSFDLQNMVGRAATRGSSFYARRLDAPVRFLNLAHEARIAGINTAAEFKKLIDYAENPTGKFANRAKYEQVLRRANSVSMAYDRMSAWERNTIARGVWFYPWIKAATTYGGHVIAEHPTGSSIAINQGVQQEKQQPARMPSFAYGMGFLGGNKTTQPGYLLPFQTGGQALDTLAHPFDVLSNNLNPVYASALAGAGMGRPANPAFGTSQGAEALGALMGSTPEWKTLVDYLNPSYAAKKTHLFPHTWEDDLVTSFLGGPAYPRKTNKKALNFDWGLEHGKYRQIYIPNKKK